MKSNCFEKFLLNFLNLNPLSPPCDQDRQVMRIKKIINVGWSNSKFSKLTSHENDQHLISPYSNIAELFTKIMRIKEMFANLRSCDP